MKSAALCDPNERGQGMTTGNVIVCPDCGHRNIEGYDECENCRSDLRTIDVPVTVQPETDSDLTGSLADVQLSAPVIVAPHTTVADAIAAMQRHETAAIVVVEGGMLRGIFTDRDVLKRVALQALSPETPVSRVMTPDPVALRETDSMAVALNKMGTGGFRHIPLLRDGEVVSVLTARDALRWVMGWYFRNG